METSDISSLSVEEDNLKVEIKREGPAQIIQSSVPAQAIQAAPAVQPTPTASEAPTAPATPTADDTAGLIEIKSPMVGTFYASPIQNLLRLSKLAKHNQKGDVVCIIEAMKLFNEIEAEIEGTIEKVCLENSAPVEFGQTLFLVRK